MEEDTFDFEAFKKEAIQKLRNKEPLTGKDGVLQPLIKKILEAALEAEIDEHLDDEERDSGNRKNGKSKKTDAFFINKQFSCMLSGLGFDAKVAHDFSTKASRGLLTYTQQSLINFFKAQPYQFEVLLDNFSFYTDAFFISIANSNQFGNNFTIAPEASLNDGLLDIVIVKKMNKLLLPFSILYQLSGTNAIQPAKNYAKNKNILYLQTDELRIGNVDKAPVHIDGDPQETGPWFDIRIVRNCFRLLRPGDFVDG